MTAKLTTRQEAEAIEGFGNDLIRLVAPFCDGFSLATVDRVNAVPDQEKLETIAKAFQRLGAQMSLECDEADEPEPFECPRGDTNCTCSFPC